MIAVIVSLVVIVILLVSIWLVAQYGYINLLNCPFQSAICFIPSVHDIFAKYVNVEKGVYKSKTYTLIIVKTDLFNGAMEALYQRSMYGVKKIGIVMPTQLYKNLSTHLDTAQVASLQNVYFVDLSASWAPVSKFRVSGNAIPNPYMGNLNGPTQHKTKPLTPAKPNNQPAANVTPAGSN